MKRDLLAIFLLEISYFVTISSLSQVNGACLDKPQLLLYKKGIVQEVISSEEPYVVLSDVAKEFLTCRSSRNVEWLYIGEGEPSKIQEEASVEINTEPEDGSLEYCMTSKISFYHKQSDTDLSKHTGRYVCQEIGNISNKASAYIYVGRRNAPTFLYSRKTINLPLSSDNLTDSSFLVPCVASTPYINATLLRKLIGSPKYQVFASYQDVKYEAESKNDSRITTFDPRYGFRVNVSAQNLSMYYGEYKCISKLYSSSKASTSIEDTEEDFVIYNLVKPPTFKATPSQKEVFTSTILNLTCESTEEPVILKEIRLRSPAGLDDYSYDDNSNDGDSESSEDDDILETVEKTEHKVHAANYLEINPVPGSVGEFQCLTEKGNKVLHTWKYRVLGKREEKLSGIKFNKRDKSFSCKTKSGLPGRLSFVSCRTPTECRINRICLEKSENCRGYSNATKALCHRGNHFCGKIFYKGGSGLIRCLGEGIDQIRGFTDEANDQKLRMGFHKLKASETALLQLSHEINPKKEFLEGEDVHLNLRLGYYNFVYPMQWAIKFRNGTSTHISPDTEELVRNKLNRNVKAKIRLPFTSVSNTSNGSTSGFDPESSDIVGINALIPLRSSMQPSWKTITLPIRITGKLPQPSENELRTGVEFIEVTEVNDAIEETTESVTEFSQSNDIVQDDVEITTTRQ